MHAHLPLTRVYVRRIDAHWSATRMYQPTYDTWENDTVRTDALVKFHPKYPTSQSVLTVTGAVLRIRCSAVDGTLWVARGIKLKGKDIVSLWCC